VSVESQKESTVHYKLALSYLRDNQLQASYVEFQKALEYDKKNKNIYNGLGIIYLKFDNPNKARENFDKAVKLDRDFSDAFNNLCYVDYLQKKYDIALKNCRHALENPLYETPQKAYYNMGRTDYRLAHYADAVSAYREALKRDDSFLPAYYGLALAYNAMGEYGAASEALDKAVKLDPAFSGNLAAAEKAFRTRSVIPPDIEEQDMKDLSEIFKY
jgi:type IV pilus assembly protein PilF